MKTSLKTCKLIAAFMAVCLTDYAYARVHTPEMVTPLLPEAQITLTVPPIKQLLSENKKFTSDTIAFYKENGYHPVWMDGQKLNQAGLIALEIFKNSANEGLNPKDYEETKNALKNNLSPEEIDVTLTNEFIRFIDDVRVGRIPPTHTARIIKITSPKTTPVKLLQEALQDSTYEKLRQMAPDNIDYQTLRKILAEYREIEKLHPDMPEISKIPLKLKTRDPDVARLRTILHAYGDYKGKDLESIDFDQELETAVKSFQKRHFIEQTGEVHEKTRKALNTRVSDLINKIIINMERLRWLPDDHVTERYILVNVGGYEVKAYTKNHLDLRIKAIVGKTTTKTPIFYAPLKNIVINPSWGVPHSILMRDKLSKILHDPTYIHRAGFTVYDASGNVIDPDQADWANEGSSYRLRQSPGSHNALGRIKLNIENPYTIYLHGTPDQKLFETVNRTHSSGCIRLQEPNQLASWVLNDSSQYTLEDLEKMIEKGSTITVPVKEKINVYFTYQTVWQGDDGEIYFSSDAYKIDPVLEKLLKTDLKQFIPPSKEGQTKYA